MKLTEAQKQKMIKECFQGLFESYPDCLETIRNGLPELFKGNQPKNIIEMWLEDDVKKFIAKGYEW